MNAMTPFDFEGQAVRVVTDEQNTPWFVGRDVCEILGISNHRDVISRLEEDERESVLVDTLGGKQQMACVNEPGFYRICFKSRKEAARRFTRWVTHEVLPALRRTGEYRMDGAPGAARGVGPHHQADVLVGAARGFSALVRAGRAMGLSRPHAVQSANRATEQATGVDLILTLDAEATVQTLESSSLPGLGAERSQDVGDFHQALRTGDIGMPFAPCLSADAHAVYKHWCDQQGKTALIMPRFIHELCATHGVPHARKRYRIGAITGGPTAFLLWGYDNAEKKPETAYLGHCVAAFQESMDAYIHGKADT